MLLIRHGRTSANAAGVLAGRMPGIMLDDVGRAGVTQLAKRISQVQVAQVVTSPLERTVETASLLFDSNVPLAHETRLIECDYGMWQGRQLSELAQDELWSVVQSTPDQMVFPDGEAMSEMATRAVEAVRQWDATLTSMHGDKVVWAAVSHGDVIKAICADAMGLPLREFQRLVIDPASVCVIHYTESGSALSKLNDTGDSWISGLEKSFVGPTLGGQTGQEVAP